METKTRRERGVYPTPKRFADLSHEYLDKVIGGEAIWWDPCSGDGALLVGCDPNTMMFASDLVMPNIPHASSHISDFLNDEEFPSPIIDALNVHRDSRWVFMMNPPYGSGVGGQYLPNGEEVRKGLSDTMVGRQMRDAKMGLATRNMACQFIWRVENIIEEHSLDAVIGLFSPASILNGPGYERFRSGFWFRRARFLGGFCFNSKNFDNITAEWPIVFSMWGNGEQDDDVTVDVIDEMRTKTFSIPLEPLSEHVERPKATVIRPPMSGPLSVATKGILVDRQAPDAMASIYADGNDVQHSLSSCFITTGPNPHTGSWSITPDNFHSSMLVFACRRLVRANWLNWRDILGRPDIMHPDYPQFRNDCILWGLFDEKNLTSSVMLEYGGRDHDLRNQFFWGKIDRDGESPYDMSFVMEDRASDESDDRFVDRWIEDRLDSIPSDLFDMLVAFSDFTWATMRFRHLCDPKFQLWRWDAGLYQVRRGMESISDQIPPSIMRRLDEFKRLHAVVEDRLRPFLYTLGVLGE